MGNKYFLQNINFFFPKHTLISSLCMSTNWIHFYFKDIFTKENNYCDLLFVSLNDEARPKWRLLSKERQIFVL